MQMIYIGFRRLLQTGKLACLTLQYIVEILMMSRRKFSLESVAMLSVQLIGISNYFLINNAMIES